MRKINSFCQPKMPLLARVSVLLMEGTVNHLDEYVIVILITKGT